MMPVARHVTMAEWGCLAPGHDLIHDRDGKCCPAFQRIIDEAEVTRVPLPPRSPNLNAYTKRWVRSVQEACRSRLILCGEASLSLNATTHPTARWTRQQLLDAIPAEHAYRFLIHDRDAIFSRDLDQRVRHLGLRVLSKPPCGVPKPMPCVSGSLARCGGNA
jgi:hypothetical protein